MASHVIAVYVVRPDDNTLTSQLSPKLVDKVGKGISSEISAKVITTTRDIFVDVTPG